MWYCCQVDIGNQYVSIELVRWRQWWRWWWSTVYKLQVYKLVHWILYFTTIDRPPQSIAAAHRTCDSSFNLDFLFLLCFFCFSSTNTQRRNLSHPVLSVRWHFFSGFCVYAHTHVCVNSATHLKDIINFKCVSTACLFVNVCMLDRHLPDRWSELSCLFCFFVV